jgi:hypothetical protein
VLVYTQLVNLLCCLLCHLLDCHTERERKQRHHHHHQHEADDDAEQHLLPPQPAFAPQVRCMQGQLQSSMYLAASSSSSL